MMHAWIYGQNSFKTHEKEHEKELGNFYELSMNNLYDSVNVNENLKADC